MRSAAKLRRRAQQLHRQRDPSMGSFPWKGGPRFAVVSPPAAITMCTADMKQCAFARQLRQLRDAASAVQRVLLSQCRAISCAWYHCSRSGHRAIPRRQQVVNLPDKRALSLARGRGRRFSARRAAFRAWSSAGSSRTWRQRRVISGQPRLARVERDSKPACGIPHERGPGEDVGDLLENRRAGGWKTIASKSSLAAPFRSYGRLAAFTALR